MKNITLKARFADKRGAGEYYRDASINGAPVVYAELDYESIERYLTPDEIAWNYGLFLLSSPYAEGEVPRADKDALTAGAAGLGAAPGTWFDISLYEMQEIWWGDPVAKLESKSTCKLYSVDVPIKLTAKIPETLQKADRTFYVLSCHNGNVTAAAQGTGSELTWKTDKFSTYLIAYSDPKIKSVTLSKTSFGYNGKVQKPTVTVKDSTGKTVDKKYYTVTYSDKNQPGICI